MLSSYVSDTEMPEVSYGPHPTPGVDTATLGADAKIGGDIESAGCGACAICCATAD